MTQNPYRQAYLDQLRSRGISVQSGHYERPNGQASWWSIQTPNARAQALLVHGTGDDSFFPFVPLIDKLLERNFSIFTFDLDGHGCDSTTLLDRNHLLTAVPQAYVQLSNRLPCWIIGFSLGASLTCAALQVLPNKPEGAVLLAPVFKLEPSLSSLWPEARGFFRQTFWQAPDFGKVRHRIPAIGPFGRRAHPLRLDPDGEQNYIKLLQEFFKEESLLPEHSSIPTLVVYGEEDRIAEPLALAAWQRHFSQVEVKSIGRCPHFCLPYHGQTLAWVDEFVGC